MKSTPRKKLYVHGQFGTQRNLYSTDLRWNFALGVMQILTFTLGITQILAFLDTNMLVFPTLILAFGGLSLRKCYRVAVKYRL